MMTQPNPISLMNEWLAAATRTSLGGALPFPTLDAGELEKRIAELKTVEAWLQSHLAGIQALRHTLELQRAALTAWQPLLQATTSPKGPSSEENEPPNPLVLWQNWFKAMQEQAQQALTSLQAASSPEPASAPEAQKERNARQTRQKKPSSNNPEPGS